MLNRIPDTEAEYLDSHEDVSNPNPARSGTSSAREIKSHSSANLSRKNSNARARNNKLREFQQRFEKPKPQAQVVTLDLKGLTRQLARNRQIQGDDYNITLVVNESKKLLLS